MKRTLGSITTLLVALPLLFGLIGCSDDDDATPTTPTVPGSGSLRVVHAAVDAPAVDIYVSGDDTPLIEDLAYGQASDYLDVDAGTYLIELRAHGAAPDSPAAFATEVTLGGDQIVTAVAAGLLGSTDDTDRFRILPLVEDFADPGAGNAAVRILHAAPDAPAVALDIGNDGVPEVTDFARFAETGAAGVALPAGLALRVGVWAGEPLARASVFTTPALPAGANLFLIATGLLGGDPQNDGFSLLAVGPAGAIGFIRQDERAMVYALHGSPDAPAVDIDAAGTEVVTSLAFGELSDGLTVWPGAYELDFRAAGATAVAASATTPYLEPGMSYLAIATGFLGGAEPAFQLLPVAEGFSAGGPLALVRVVHAGPDAPAVDVGPVVEGQVAVLPGFENLAFGDASDPGGEPLPVGELTVGIAATGTVEPVVSFDLATAAGLRAFAVAAGSLTGPGESFRLVLVIADDAGWSAVEVMPDR